MPSLAARLAHWLSPEEHRLSLDGGRSVRQYLEGYQCGGISPMDLKLCRLEPRHLKLCSSLHRGADSDQVIASALLYSATRLPDCMPHVDQVAIASSDEALNQAMALWPTDSWRRVEASKRRRLAYFDGGRRLAVLVTSISDMDDIIPGLCAYQIEWNKMHHRLARVELGRALVAGEVRASSAAVKLRHALGLNRPDFNALLSLWGEDWEAKMAAVAAGAKDMSLHIMPRRSEDFPAMARRWWDGVAQRLGGLDLAQRPVYLVTSNDHSLVNLVSGFTGRHQARIREHARQGGSRDLHEALRRAEGQEGGAARNLLYYAQEGLLAQDPELARAKAGMEQAAGVRRTERIEPLLSVAQAFELNRIDPDRLDPRLRVKDPAGLAASRAVILNTDYPLGFAAFHLLMTAGRRLKQWRGLFILGKSAAMIGRLGDLLIPTQVRDVHFQRLYGFDNRLGVRRLIPYLNESAVFDDQRSLTVHGTFLHSWETVRDLYRADFTGIEMEAGPCLAALAEHFDLRPPEGPGLFHLDLPEDFHLGILHYTSDTPYNLRASLLSQPLGLAGLESTYSASLAILQYIIDQESGEADTGR